MKNYETTLKNHGNQPKTMKPQNPKTPNDRIFDLFELLFVSYILSSKYQAAGKMSELEAGGSEVIADDFTDEDYTLY